MWMRDNRVWLSLIGFFLLILMVAASFFLVSAPSEHRLPERRHIKLNRDIAEDVRVSRFGFYGIDFVSCARARIEKLKRGPFALGCFNVLVLDELKVVLPDVRGKSNMSAADSTDCDASNKLSPSELLSQMGVTPDFLAMNGIAKRFLGLRINGLEINRLDAATNVVRVLTACKAEIKRGGLELSDTTIMVDRRQENISKAMLKRSKKSFKVVWSTGEFKLF
jgi:hypothetical protein